MTSDIQRNLEQTRRDLAAQVYAGDDQWNASLRKQAWDPENPSPMDPELDAALRQVFRMRPAGQLEWLRMEVDLLRRLAISRDLEAVFRPYGVVYLVAPVRVNGKLVHALHSGPLKVDSWMPRERDTLAKICGVSPSALPVELEQVRTFNQAQVQVLEDQLRRQAALLATALANTPPPSTAAPTTGLPSPGPGLDLLQPGLADHLDVLFSTIQAQTGPLAAGSDSREASSRIAVAAGRGRRLLEQIRRLRTEVDQSRIPLSVHTALTGWMEDLGVRMPDIRFQPKLEAEEDVVQANPHALNHLLYSLLAGVADGLGPGQGFVGVSTRNEDENGVPSLHIEIRDGGGLATFAGVDARLDEELLREQNDEAETYSDWIHLAERMHADIRILQDEDVVTRVGIILPLVDPSHDESAGIDRIPRHQIWLVGQDAAGVEILRHMLPETEYHMTQLADGGSLQDYYQQALVPPDLILLEYNLPDIRGAALRTWIYEQDPDLPVILMSGYTATHPGIATASNLPSTLYLQKPFDEDALLDLLRMVLKETMPGD